MRRLWLKPTSHMGSVETQKTWKGDPPPPAYQECGPPPPSYDQITGSYAGQSYEAIPRLCVCLCVFVFCVCVCARVRVRLSVCRVAYNGGDWKMKTTPSGMLQMLQHMPAAAFDSILRVYESIITIMIFGSVPSFSCPCSFFPAYIRRIISPIISRTRRNGTRPLVRAAGASAAHGVESYCAFQPMNYFMFIRMEACLLFPYADII